MTIDRRAGLRRLALLTRQVAISALLATFPAQITMAQPLIIKMSWTVLPANLTPLMPMAPKEIYRHWDKSYVLAPERMRGSGAALTALAADQIRHAVEKVPFGPYSHMDYLNKIGTNVQAISPRPFQLMHSEKPAKIVQWFQEEVNNVIYRQTQLYPDRFFGVCGIPQPAGEPLDMAIRELERCV
jgi:hypothetical protein